jgi:hypothetical protein
MVETAEVDDVYIVHLLEGVSLELLRAIGVTIIRELQRHSTQKWVEGAF